MRRIKRFKPFPLMEDPHAQTIAAAFFCSPRLPDYYTHFMKLPDQDVLTYEVSEPQGWTGSDPTIVMVHGLCGQAKSSYLVRLTRKFYHEGYRCIRVNLRGCGTSQNRTKMCYHSGSSGDIFESLTQIKNECPDSPITLMGFSLGGNIVLKLAGELGMAANSLIAKLIAINPPVDIYSSVKLLRQPENRFYEQYFYKYLRQDVHRRHRFFQDLPKVKLPLKMSMYEFDEYYMAPFIGYKSAIEYYDKTSSYHVIPNITVPCHILFSSDDPIVDSSVINEIDLPDNVEVLTVDGGGHLGFLRSTNNGKSIRFLDHQIAKWINTHPDAA